MPSNDNNVFGDNSLFSSGDRRSMFDEVKNVTTPVRPDDFIHIQVQFLLKILKRQEAEPSSYKMEAQHKDRIINSLYNSNAQPFRSTEEQLGKFFQPIINKLVIFRDEVLIDFREGVKDDDSKKV